MYILGIESSCDETAAAICKDGTILSNVVLSQEIHTQFGGVVPELASREHDSSINFVVNSAIIKSKIDFEQIDAIAVTYGAGLMGALLVGLNYAKGLSIALNIPFIGVNHLEGHLFASNISKFQMLYPYLCLLVTGGHTQIWEVQSPGKYKLHSNTVDDAAGEAFDKGARILGLKYPGGPEIEKMAEKGNQYAINFPRPLMKQKNFEFSFSGLKTSLLYCINENKIKNTSDIAASYQFAIIEVLSTKLKWAVEEMDCHTCVIAGGVAANKLLRSYLKDLLPNHNVIFPKMSLCTDNAAMIAYLGEIYFNNHHVSEIDFQVFPNMRLA